MTSLAWRHFQPKIAFKVFRADIVAFIVPVGSLDQRVLTGTGWTICTLTPKGDYDFLKDDFEDTKGWV